MHSDLIEALVFFSHRGDATGSEESVKLSLSLMGLNDADVESEFVEHVADNGGPEGDDPDADTEDQHQASDPDGEDMSDVGPQPAVQKRRRKSQEAGVRIPCPVCGRSFMKTKKWSEK